MMVPYTDAAAGQRDKVAKARAVPRGQIDGNQRGLSKHFYRPRRASGGRVRVADGKVSAHETHRNRNPRAPFRRLCCALSRGRRGRRRSSWLRSESWSFSIFQNSLYLRLRYCKSGPTITTATAFFCRVCADRIILSWGAKVLRTGGGQPDSAQYSTRTSTRRTNKPWRNCDESTV